MSLFIIGHMGLFVYTQKGSIIPAADLPTTEIIEPKFITLNMSEAFKEMFFVVIQLGAILAVVVMFWNKMFPFQLKDKSQPLVKKDSKQSTFIFKSP